MPGDVYTMSEAVEASGKPAANFRTWATYHDIPRTRIRYGRSFIVAFDGPALRVALDRCKPTTAH